MDNEGVKRGSFHEGVLDAQGISEKVQEGRLVLPRVRFPEGMGKKCRLD